MKSLALTVSFSLATLPAAAEVCDKARPSWNPTNGPISQLDDLVLFMWEPIGIAILGMVGVSLLIKKNWVTAICIGIVSLVISFMIAEWLWVDHPVLKQAIKEGCMAPPLLTTFVLLMLIAFLVVFARSRKVP